ncbi:MAG: alkaline phosphatase D family protein [Proteobacteria bacterium]|nr:alkaline phosphatase D family protein [Pseudomonadota bacterium]
MAKTSRRQFIAAGAASILLPSTLMGCKQDGSIQTTVDSGDTGDTGDTGEVIPQIAFEPEALVEDATRFPLALQAGGMRPTSALLTTWTPQGGPVMLRVWQPVDDGMVDLFHESIVEPEPGGFLRAEVEGLPEGAWLEWGFFPVDSDDQPIGRSLLARFRTALPEDSLEPVTLAMTACNGSGNAPWPALQATAELDYDLFCHLGDMAYNDGAETLEEYRSSWREFLSGDGFRQAYAKAGLYAVWDDHEFDNDWNPESMDPDQIEAAKQAFFEHVAAERASDGTSWMSYRWGKTAEFFVLDCRSERKPSTRNDPDAEYISAEQLDWLVRGLNESPCHFKVVLNSVPITNMPLIWDVAASDRWEGYRDQRQAFLDAVDDLAIDNLWLLSGDFHVCFVSKLEPNGDKRSDNVHEIAVTGGNINPLGESLFGGQFLYNTSQPRALTLRFDPEADSVEVTFIDPDDGSVAWSESLSYST